MDTSTDREILNRVLVTVGDGKFTEQTYELPPLGDNEIRVQSVMTGICRSDIDMMEGNFGPLPVSMQGHEGLGRVFEIGDNVTDVRIGDYVATRGEPAYADFYSVRAQEYVLVPEAHPKYILEPVACGINVVHQPLREIAERSGPGKRLLILGSGFLAWIAYNTLLLNHVDFEITVVGNSNRDLWQDRLSPTYQGKFDVVIDLSGKDDVFTKDMVNEQALVVMGVQKKIQTDFGNLLWKACTVIFPSPRTNQFYSCMKDAATWIRDGDIVVDSFWTEGYNRDTEWQQAFADGVDRPAGYSRGYLYWNNNGN